jgi:simple sugar transport system ATP-binding protein
VSDLADPVALRPRAAVAPLLEVRHLRKHFGAVQALKDLSMTVRRGEVVAVAGDNGAGKTTLIKALSGVYAPTGGEILLDGAEVRFASPQEARARGIETIYQDLALADNLTIGGNIFLGREPMRRAFGLLPVIDRRAMAEAARATMARLDFHVSRMDAPVSAFSGGQRQAVAIGRAVYWNAQLLIMDEPTAALGVPEQRKVISLIRQLREQGRGVVFISHNLQDIFAVSDRIVVLRRGIMAGERRIEDTSHEEVVRLMIGG